MSSVVALTFSIREYYTENILTEMRKDQLILTAKNKKNKKKNCFKKVLVLKLQWLKQDRFLLVGGQKTKINS